nr:recombinase family protein [Nocardia zapadnayensis]
MEIDPERAKLVAWAFMVYASGEWTTRQLHEELTARGLRAPATPRRPSRPIGKSSIQRMLTNPYYKGDVRYQGVTYKGHARAVGATGGLVPGADGLAVAPDRSGC